jgi:hypothetical protein
VFVVADLTHETQNDQNNYNENDHEYHCQTLVSVVWSRCRCRCRGRSRSRSGCWRRNWGIERILTLVKNQLRRSQISVASCALSDEKLSCLGARSVVLNKVSKEIREEGSAEYFVVCLENIEIASS